MLLEQIRQCDFALYELNLYLDTHPNCRNALNTFRKYREMRNNAVFEYAKKYGSLTADMAEANGIWDWIKGVWPWEEGAE